MKHYDAIVIGGGHAGIEASLVLARNNFSTLLVTLSISSIGKMSCNPAIGGSAKGHIVREIDALGGEMGKAIDQTGIQFSMLNYSKGPAVWAPRAQADKYKYQRYMQNCLENQANLDIIQNEVKSFIIKNEKVIGIKTKSDEVFFSKVTILTTGTFLRGLMHTGNVKKIGGRVNDQSAEFLSTHLKDLGFKLSRLKTGTPPRLDKDSIDFSKTEIQKLPPLQFTFSCQSEFFPKNKINCFITYTNPEIHELILNNLDKAPMYSGQIQGIGPRYCPSIEDKVVRFSNKSRHQLFLEPESLETNEIYINGLSTSLPFSIQEIILKKIPGLEKVKILQSGYAVEYDFSYPHQLKSTLETKLIENLFFAGQINGTSGYEEAACQGLVAGMNAILKIKEEPPFILSRTESYIGVLIDDLTTKDIIQEPYRMFTSRAEYRLNLRYDNVYERLIKYGYEFNLISESLFNKMQNSIYKVEKMKKFIEEYFIKKSEVNKFYFAPKPGISLFKFIKQNINQIFEIKNINPQILNLNEEELNSLKSIIKYDGYIEKQDKQIAFFKKFENMIIPEDVNYDLIEGLLTEAREKLKKFKPFSIAQASKISGVNPSDINIILMYLKKGPKNSKKISTYY